MFDKNNTDWIRNQVIKPQMKLFENAAKSLLGKKLAYIAFVDLKAYSGHSVLKSEVPTVGVQRAAMCSCSTESDWCWGSCSSGGCSQSHRQCGTLWQHECDGGC